MADQEIITSEKPKLTPTELIVHDDSEYAMLFDSAKFNQAYRVATAFSQSGLVPDHFKDNPAGVFVVLHMATRMQLDPFMVLQKTYMVHGRPGMEAQLVIALVNARGPFTGPIQWRFEGEGKNRKCIAYATHAKTGEICEATVTWAMVDAEGWNKKSGSKWLTLESLMFQYRSATFLARLYCPEVIMGLSTADELEDSAITLDTGVTISPRPKTVLPEAPEADPAAVKEFVRLVSQETQDEAIADAVERYVAEIAALHKTTKEDIMSQASTPKDFPVFWKTFLAWNKPDKKSPGRPKKTEGTDPAQSPTQSPEGAGEGGSGPVAGITEDQLTDLRKVPDDLLADAFMECQVDRMDLKELDEKSAAALIAWLAKQ